MSVATDSLLVAHSLMQAASQTDSDIFHCVMVIHVQITNGFHCQVKQPVSRKQCQHVIKETNAGRNF